MEPGFVLRLSLLQNLYLLIITYCLSYSRILRNGIFSAISVNKDAISQFSSVQLLSRVQLFESPWTAARQASLYTINSRSLLKLMSIELVMLSNHLILCHPLLLLPLTFPSIRVFSKESVLCIRWPKYWSFSFSISPSNEYSGLISFRIDWFDLLANPRDSQESSPTPQFKTSIL